MPILKEPQLQVVTDRALGQATVVVRSEVDFTDFEVNAMNELGLPYLLQCELLDMDMLYDDGQVVFQEQTFPTVDGQAKAVEPVVFETSVPMRTLHRYLFGEDPLTARLTLRNTE